MYNEEMLLLQKNLRFVFFYRKKNKEQYSHAIFMKFLYIVPISGIYVDKEFLNSDIAFDAADNI